MNRLKKKAWTGLIASLGNLLPVWAVVYMAKLNTQLNQEILWGLGICIPLIVIFMLLWKKYIWKRSLEQLDEREKEMYLKAIHTGTHICAGYMISLSFIIFLKIGGGGSVAVVSLPLLAFSGIFVAGITQSGILLFQVIKEEHKNTEGGVA